MKSRITIRAVYENGIVRLLEPADLEEGQEVEVIAAHKKSGNTGTGRKPNLHPGSMQMRSCDFTIKHGDCRSDLLGRQRTRQCRIPTIFHT